MYATYANIKVSNACEVYAYKNHLCCVCTQGIGQESNLHYERKKLKPTGIANFKGFSK